MSNDPAKADPETIRNMANDLSAFSNYLEETLSSLEGGIEHLNSGWSDEQFARFREFFNTGTVLSLRRFVEKSRETVPMLNEDARRLDELYSYKIEED